ncbi:MAG: choice-of-anchor tandem repeat GloVer-containing protein [Candidatus Tumulicola sp.]
MRTMHWGRNVCGCVATALITACGGGVAPLYPSLDGPSTAVAAVRHARPDLAYEVIHTFGGSGGGTNPRAALIHVDNAFYGTTLLGGAHDKGTVFGITSAGDETVLHSFGGPNDGVKPYAPLVNVKGALYGTTGYGGANNKGTVFVVLPFGGGEKVLHSFGSGGDGATPLSGLIDVKGTLYGTTAYGGINGNGTVFAITTSGDEKVIYNFRGSGDGKVAFAGLVDVGGIFYSTTSGGGAHGKGTIYSISTSGDETVLHSFGGPGDGENPYIAGLVEVKNTLYGTTASGGANDAGTVFALPSFGKERVLHSFGGPGDGNSPRCGLIDVDGTLYGTTFAGGQGHGTVFSITTSGTETVLHSFAGNPDDGAAPYGALVHENGRLYGTTPGGGTHDEGTIYALTPP